MPNGKRQPDIPFSECPRIVQGYFERLNLECSDATALGLYSGSVHHQLSEFV